MSTQIAIVGDFNPANESHVATNAALEHGSAALGMSLDYDWVSTEEAAGSSGWARIQEASGLWIAPASPYRNMNGALGAIRFARERRIPLLGTCGGFQHIIIEYARNVLGMPEAEHGETAPEASQLVISRLACSLVGRTMMIRFQPGSRVAQAYGSGSARERYYCNFGVNPVFASRLFGDGLHPVASDDEGTVRAVELGGHPFFVGTLFLPQLGSTPEAPHPLVSVFLTAARQK